MIRGLGGADRMLIAQMDAAVTPLGPMSGDTSELERALDAVDADRRRAPTSRARSASRPTRCAALDNAGDRRRLRRRPRRRRATRRARCTSATSKLSYVPDRQAARATSAITQFSVRRYPLDKSRYEVMLEVTNTGAEPEDVELSLLGDGNARRPHASSASSPGERLPRFYPNLSGAEPHARGEARARSTARSDDLPADDHAYALLPERRRAQGARRLAGQHVPRGGAAPRRVPRRHRRRRRRRTPQKSRQRREASTSIIFDGATPARAAARQRALPRPARPGLAGEGRGRAQAARLRQDRRKHPHRALHRARRREHRARPQARAPSRATRSSARATKGPLLVAGHARRLQVRRARLRRRARAICRCASPGRCFLLNSINWFTDEDAQLHLELPHRRRVARPGRGSGATQATLEAARTATTRAGAGPRRARGLPRRSTRASTSSRVAEAATPNDPDGDDRRRPRRSRRTCSTRDESTIAPARRSSTVDGKARRRRSAGSTSACAARSGSTCCSPSLLVTALEWVTYHRRITV